MSELRKIVIDGEEIEVDPALTLIQACEAAGVTLVVHENFRFMPWYRAIKSQIDEGRIGEVLQATFRLRPGDGQGPDAGA